MILKVIYRSKILGVVSQFKHPIKKIYKTRIKIYSSIQLNNLLIQEMKRIKLLRRRIQLIKSNFMTMSYSPLGATIHHLFILKAYPTMELVLKDWNTDTHFCKTKEQIQIKIWLEWVSSRKLQVLRSQLVDL